MDQLMCKIDDSQRLAHIEHKDFTATGHHGSLKDELAGIRNGGEIAAHFGMRYGERTARGNLFLENRDNAAAGTEHVAEANRG